MLKPKRFIYKNAIKWQEEKKGLFSSSGKPNIEVAAPPEFKGHPGIWSPEDLFVAAVNSCIMTTFLYYTEKGDINLSSYESEAEGILKMAENGLAFSEIKVKPRIIVNSSSVIKRAKELIGLSEKNCLISNSIKFKVEVIPEVLSKG